MKSSYAELIRLGLLANFGIVVLEFLFLTCAWKSCWTNKRHYWTYKLLFVIIEIPYSITVLYYTNMYA